MWGFLLLSLNLLRLLYLALFRLSSKERKNRKPLSQRRIFQTEVDWKSAIDYNGLRER
jgi:hypothetical protein